MNNSIHPFRNMRNDLPASIIVFLVAMPLCLGIAQASDAPLFSGLIAGVIGGIVVGALSGSPLGVSGPAAGLAVIVADAIPDLGSFQIFLAAVVIAGVIQVILGFLRAGVIAYFFPSSVIHGLLAGIGILIAFKQIPHIFGDDSDPEGDLEFIQPDGENTFSEMFDMLNYISPGALIVAGISLALLILWESKFIKQQKYLRLVPAPLLVVILGIFLTQFLNGTEQFAISAEHMVKIPVSGGINSVVANLSFPDFAAFTNPKVYLIGLIIAAIASIETLLCVEAADKLDEFKRSTPTNRELKAQGVGNILSGLIGGLPVTQVIVRSSANAQAGGRTKTSTVLHGTLLLLSVILIPGVLKMIPMASLAAILLVVGYKLAKPALFKKMFKLGWEQWIPFMATIIGILATDLLIGIGIGIAISIFVILRNNFKVAYKVKRSDEHVHIELAQEVSFLNKASVKKLLDTIEDGKTVVLDAQKNKFLHHDVYEIIQEFLISSKTRDLHVTIQGMENSKIS
jgi:MFS superfamily sulfate permease-like transporter